MTLSHDPTPIEDRGGMFTFYRRVLPHFRRRRMQLFVESLGITAGTRVLDVGGGAYNWQWCRPRPQVVVLNLNGGDVAADGCRLPFRDRSFDIVFSNSVIEHVGGAEDQATFASEVARVGRGYFVQTPNKYFPLEPHLMVPFIQFLPLRARLRLARNFTVWGLVNRPSAEVAHGTVSSIRLLKPAEMTRLFPDGDLHRERLLGLTKSLVTVRGEAEPVGRRPSSP